MRVRHLHLKIINELANIDGKMELETRTKLQKNLPEEINEIKKTLTTREVSLFVFPVCYLVCYHNG